MKKNTHIIQGKRETFAPRDINSGNVGVMCKEVNTSENEGGENGSVSGCNANNGQASVRTANCNNNAYM